MRHGFGFLTLIKLRVDPVKLLHLLQKGIMRGEKKSQCVKLDIFEAAEGRKNLPVRASGYPPTTDIKRSEPVSQI